MWECGGWNDGVGEKEGRESCQCRLKRERETNEQFCRESNRDRICVYTERGERKGEERVQRKREEYSIERGMDGTVLTYLSTRRKSLNMKGTRSEKANSYESQRKN